MKILIIRLSSIGDILLTTAFIRQARQCFPKAEIDFIVKRKFSTLLKFNPHLNRVFEFDNEQKARLSEFIEQFESSSYDYIFDLHNNPRSIYLRYKISGENKTYIRKDKLAQIALVKLKIRKFSTMKSIPQRYLEVGQMAGITDDKKGLEIYWDLETETRLNEFLIKEKVELTQPTIGIAPGAGYFTKRWPIEYFEDLIENISNKFKYNFCIIGGQKEIEIGKRLAQTPNVYNFCGKLNLLESGLVISKINCLISNDSGMMHMATAVETPVLAIFGSSVKEFGFYPYRAKSIVVENNEAKCRPCSHIGKNSCPKQHFMCMREITPEIVLNKVMETI